MRDKMLELRRLRAEVAARESKLRSLASVYGWDKISLDEMKLTAAAAMGYYILRSEEKRHAAENA